MTEPKHKTYKAVAPTYLTMYERCPRQFKYVRIDGIKSVSPDSEILVFGNFVHYAMEEYLGGGLNSNEAFLKTHCDRILPRYDSALVAKAFERSKRAYEWVVRQVDGILNSAKSEYISEMMFRCENRFGTGISGRIDLIVFFPEKRKFRVYDFKGTYSVPSDDQLVFYYWALKNSWPDADVDLFYLWFTKKLYKKATITEAVEVAMNDRVNRMLNCVHNGEFPTVKGKHCSWCGFKSYCPEFGGTDAGSD